MTKWSKAQLRRLDVAVRKHGSNWKLIQELHFPRRNRNAIQMQHQRRGSQQSGVRKRTPAWTAAEERIVAQWHWHRGPAWRALELSGELPGRKAKSIAMHYTRMPASQTSPAAKPALSPPAAPLAVRARPSSTPFDELDVKASLITVRTTRRHVGCSWTASVQQSLPCPTPTPQQLGFKARWRLDEAAGGAQIIAVEFWRGQRILQRHLQRTEGLTADAAEKAAKTRRISRELRDELKMAFYPSDSLPTARENPGSRLWLGGPGMGVGRLERPEEMLAQHGVPLNSPQQRAAKSMSLSATRLWQVAGESMHARFADMLLANAFELAGWDADSGPLAYGSCWSGGLDAIYGVRAGGAPPLYCARRTVAHVWRGPATLLRSVAHVAPPRRAPARRRAGQGSGRTTGRRPRRTPRGWPC